MGEVIGDGLIKLPFLASLRGAFPAARISWCAAKGETVYQTTLRDVVAGALDEVVAGGRTGVAPSEFFLLQRPFGGRRFDVVIDTQTNVRRSLVVRRAAGLFISPSLGFRLSDRRPTEPWPLAMVDRLQTLASLACGRPVAPRPVSLAEPSALAAARRLLPEGPVYVGFAPGSGGVSKRWPLERYVALAARQRALGRVPVFLLGPGEREMGERIRAEVQGALFPEEAPHLEVGGPLLVIALAGRLACAVANDAGPGHMLAAGGAPLVSLQQGARRAAKFHPAAQKLEMLVAEDFGGGEDMRAIPLDRVEAAVERLLTEV